MMEDFTDAEVKAIHEGVKHGHSVSNGAVDYMDCWQEAWVWVLENRDRIVEMRESGKKYDRWLRNSAYHVVVGYTRAEMMHRTGSHISDFAVYTAAHIQDMLPALFLGESFNTGHEVNEEVKHKTSPAEGGNGLATMTDIKVAFTRLGQEQKQLLFYLYGEGPTSYEKVARKVGVSSMTVRRREQRALDQMVDTLGGPRVQTWRRRNGGVQ